MEHTSRFITAGIVTLLLLLISGCSSSDSDNDAPADTNDGMQMPMENENEMPDVSMVFFLTSTGLGDGGNLGGLAGADVHCTNLAQNAGVEDKTWRAYLSTTGADGENAIDRIGEGPWFNANGVQVAESPADLISDNNNLNKETSISENGEVINGMGDDPNRHDILTGTRLDGTAAPEGIMDTTCGNWTRNDSTGSAIVGHHDRMGGGDNPMSWSTAHGSNGCSQANLQSTAGDGLFYCFAIN